MAALLTMVPPEKEDLSNKKTIKIGAFVQKLLMNNHSNIYINIYRRIL